MVERCYAECHLCEVSIMVSVLSKLIVLSVVMLNVIMLNVVMLIVVMLGVVAYWESHYYTQKRE
jgi:hypothetical protein